LKRKAEGLSAEERAVVRLPEQTSALPKGARNLFDRIYRVNRTIGRLNPPEAMHDWIRRHFGSLEAVERQTIVKITNQVTLEEALFNELRASRPVETRRSGDLLQEIAQSAGDPFCHPLEGTPEDVFGRIEGAHSITASNVAKYDAYHGLVVFDKHNPLEISELAVRDYLDVGYRWAERALKADPEAKYYFFMWNALWRSGASIVHGHAQVASTQGAHYSKVEHLRRSALNYRLFNGTNYFDDLVRVHKALGLALSYQGVSVLVNLTPVREKEVLLISFSLSGSLAGAIYRVLDCMLTQLGVSSFNLAIYMPPLSQTPEDWSGFPYVTRIVDRGNPAARTSDVGAMELFASPVTTTDPFRVIEPLRQRFLR